jgi:hypothetical protein
MILVVAGPIKTKFTRLVAKTVRIGARTLHRFTSARVPFRPDAVPKGDLAPGYVSASTAGSAVCSEKYMGKIFCWRDENWARGIAVNATGPAIKD